MKSVIALRLLLLWKSWETLQHYPDWQNESRIIESIKHVGFSQNSYRTILHESTYIAPPKTDAKNPFDIPDEKLFEILQTEDLSARNLQKLFQGLGRDTANELSTLLETDKLKNFRSFFNREVKPNLTAKAFSAVRFSDSQDQPEFETLSALLDYYYLDKAARDRVAPAGRVIWCRVQNELEKNKEKAC